MDECGDYSIRGDVAKIRERDPMMNYPFLLPQGLTEEQIRSLLPLLTSRKCKRWDCLLCVKQFMEQDCPHDQQQLAAIEAAGPSIDAVHGKKANNRSIVEKIDAVEVLICTEVECITNKQQSDNSEPKVFFDLNVPIVEPYDEALETSINNNNHAPATEELAVAHNPECTTSELVSVDKQQTINLEAPPEPEAYAQVPNNGIGNSGNVSSPPEILAPNGKKTLRIKKARKYHSISFLNQECKREGSQNAPNSIPESNKTELKNKKKMQQCRTDQEGPGGTKISEATENGSEQNRTIDCNLPLKQNFVLANVSPSPRRESRGKRKHQVNNDQNGSSDAIVTKSSEEGHRNESRSVDIQLRKRRIFCSVTKTPLADADKSQRAEPVGHKSKKNRPSRKESLIIPVADLGNSHPTRIKKAKRKEAYQLIMLRRKQKNINGGEPSGTALDKISPERSSPVVAGKELVLLDKPISTIEKDVQMPCLHDDNFNLKQLKSEIIKTLKRHKFDPPSADNNNQKVIRTDENGTCLLTHSDQKSGGNGKGHADLMLAAPQEKKKKKKKEIDQKSSPNMLKTRGRLKKVPSGSGSTKKKQAASVGKNITTNLRKILPCEAALQLLSMVAVDTLENRASLPYSGDGLTFLPIMEEFHVPPITSVLEMGYEGCIEVTNPADYFLVDGEGDRFKLGPEDLPLRPRRLLPPKILPLYC